LEDIGKVIGQVCELAREYKRLTGKPLGITGEVAEFEAARILGLTLAEARTPGYDALRGEERIQIKGRVIGKDAKPGQRLGQIRLDHEWDAVLLVLLDEEFKAKEIWEADRKAITAALSIPGSKARNERGAMAVSGFKRIGRRVWPL
jgi:hypothetical protein